MTSSSMVTVRAARAPFPGLRSFSPQESEFFFGREGQSDELALKLGQSRFVAVVGTSGSGKSSLVRAGLLPSLDSGCLVKAGSNWRIVDMRPGSRPIDNLATALDIARICETPADPGALRGSSLALLDFASQAFRKERLTPDGNLLLLVDQFEELFRYPVRDMNDRDEKAAFVKLLLEVSKQRTFHVYVVITMRSDFLGDCARFRDLPEAINAGQYLIPRMTRDQRREAIEGPIHMAGGAITQRLAQRILNDVGEDPDQLPLMQHALMRTWYQWRNSAGDARPVDIEDYEAVGALDNALSGHADKAYSEASRKVPERGAQIVRRIFQRLRERDASGRETRRPTSLSELCAVSEASEEEVLAVLECFRREGRSFLMPPTTVDLRGDREVDITHESLLRQWKRLQGLPSDDSGWLAEEEESRRNIMRLADRAEQQVRGNPDYLRGPLLQLALDWWNRRRPTESWAERYTPNFRAAETYLRESEGNQKRDFEREEERKRAEEAARLEQGRREQELKEKQRKARAAYFLAVLTIIVAVGAISGILQVQRARDQVAVLEEQQRAQAELEESRNAAVQEALHIKEQADAKAKAEEAEKDARNSEKARLATSVQLLASKAALVGTEGETQLPLSMLLAAESMRRQLLTDNEAVLSKGLQLLLTPLSPLANSAKVERATFSSDGLLVTSEKDLIRVWDLESQAQVQSFPITGSALAMLCSSDGNALAVAYNENGQGVIQGFALHTGETLGRHLTPLGNRYFISIADSGALTAEIAVTERSTNQWIIQHWKDWADVQGSEPQDHVNILNAFSSGAIAFNSDQSLVAMYDRSQSLITVNTFPIPGQKSHSWHPEEQVADIVFDPSYKNRLLSFDASGTIKIWYAISGLLALPPISAGPTANVQFSADGRLLATSNVGGMIRIWDSRDGREVGRAFTGASGDGDVAVDTVNGIVALPQKGSPKTQQGPLKLWRIQELPLEEEINSADMSMDGALAMLRIGATAFPWNLAKSRPEPRLDSSVMYSFLGVSTEFRRVAGWCDKQQPHLCIASLVNGKVGEVILRSTDKPLSGAIFSPPLLQFSRDERFVAGTVRRSAGTGSVATVVVWNAGSQETQPTILSAPSPDSRSAKSTDLPNNLLLLGFTPESDRCIILETPRNSSSSAVVRFWDLNKRSFSTSVPEPFLQPPVSFAFSRDGKWLATSTSNSASAGVAEQNYSIAIWRWPDAKQPVKTLNVDTRVNKMSFSADNRLLLTAGDEMFIRVWDINTGNEISRVGTLRPTLAMSFANDDRQVVTFDRYAITTSYWRAQDMMREACKRIGRSLSEQEWNKYLSAERYFPTCEAHLDK